ncbi:MAG: glycosyltransferase family 2 protein [Patescibacteria group bacterium]|jgi:glycosyltransferase involved in cell wall biosynthesis
MKFSIITPSYNQGSFISKTIESVISQRGDFEIEYFIMDGGSKDETLEIIKKYEAKIKNGDYKGANRGVKFYWQSQKDRGQSDALNQGLSRVAGDIVAYLNSDDFYEDNCFAVVEKAFAKHSDKLWLTAYCRIVNDRGTAIQGLVTRYKNLWLRRYGYRSNLILNYISQPATFWTSEALKTIGHFDEKLNYTMDYDYWLRLGRLSQPIVVDEYIADFRIHSQSKGGKQYVHQFDEDLETAKRYTSSWLLIVLHRLHNRFTKCVYRIIKG